MFSPAEVSYSVYTLYKEVEYYVTQPHLNQRFLAHILMHRLVYVKEITSIPSSAYWKEKHHQRVFFLNSVIGKLGRRQYRSKVGVVTQP